MKPSPNMFSSLFGVKECEKLDKVLYRGKVKKKSDADY
jgi:hypothetical protein